MLYKRATVLSKTLISLGLIASVVATNCAFADTNNSKDINKLSFDDNYTYFNLGVDAYTPNFPTVYSGLTTANASNILGYSFNSTYPQYDATLGYHFVNSGFLTSIFGNDNNIEATAKIINFNSGNNLDASKYQDINFNANVGGQLFGLPVNMSGGRLSVSMQQEEYSFNWTGDKLLTSNISMQPSIGPVFMQNRQNYKLSLAYFDPNGPAGSISEKNNLQTKYYGLNIGDTFAYQNNSHFTPSAGLTVSVLRALASYVSTNEFSSVPGVVYTVPKTDNALLSYKISPQFNLNYRFFDRKDSPSISLLAQLDYWTWVPKVLPSGTENFNQGQQLTHTHMWSNTIGLEFHMPLV